MFDNEENYVNENYEDINVMQSRISGFWSEKVYVVTKDYEIKGYVFMPKTGKKNRILSDILNGKKRFVAIKDAEITDKRYPERKAELHNFLQINLDSIVLIRPIKEK